ncbi:MAG: hypothetical protein NTV61_08475 [Candidatus Bathyarchaeota archaeon]|nr:hypothetical protein [Candidatus Bathyarchaeota archaeon]
MPNPRSVYAAILAFAVAFGFFTVAFALAPGWGGEALLGSVKAREATPRVVMDRRSYRVGEDVVATFEYYNPWSYDVTLVPPGRVTSYMEYPGQKDEAPTIQFYDWMYPSYTLRPGDVFGVCHFNFVATQPGNVTFIVNDMSKTVQVLPR